MLAEFTVKSMAPSYRNLPEMVTSFVGILLNHNLLSEFMIHYDT